MPPWLSVLLVSTVVASVAFGIIGHRRREFLFKEDDDDYALIIRAGTEIRALGSLGVDTRRAIVRRAAQMQRPAYRFGENAGAGGLVVLFCVGGLLLVLWISGIWDGQQWPRVQDKRPSLDAVQERASTTLERRVVCGKAARDRQYVCRDEAGHGWIIRANDDADIRIERDTRPGPGQ